VLKYDYVIERTTGPSQIDRFSPNKIPKELDNLVLIEGPNSSGKSTLLNIIALGLFGNKSSKINSALQAKMNSLLDAKHQKLQFSFEIKSDLDKLIIRSKKTDPNSSEIIVEESLDGENFSPVIYENFEKKYNLIYDIPSNPTERLPELLKELRDEQRQYGNRIKDFGMFVHYTIQQIEKSRDLQRLKEVEERLKEQREKKKTIEDELPSSRDFLNMLQKAAFIMYYYHYLSEKSRLETRSEEIKKAIEDIDKTGRKVVREKIQEKRKIGELSNKLAENYNKVTPQLESILPKKLKKSFTIWKEFNPYTIEHDELTDIEIEASNYIKYIQEEMDEISKNPVYKDVSSIERILDLLKEFEYSELRISKLNVTIQDLINILREENEKRNSIIKKYKNYDNINRILNEIKGIVKEMKESLEAYKKESVAAEEYSKSSDLKYSQLNIELSQVTNELERANKKCREYHSRCILLGIEAKKLDGPYAEILKEIPKNEHVKECLALGEENVLKTITDLEGEISEKQKEMRALEITIKQYQTEKERLEKLEPHKYESFYNELNIIYTKVNRLSQKLLSIYNNDLNNLINNTLKEDDLKNNDNSRKYFDEVSKYLAHRIGNFRHIDRTYKAKTVNLILKTIITEDGSTIYLSDMGTGQSQSAFLLSLLNIKNDNRKIIALFDEIAMMDDISLKPVYEKMKELYYEKRLLLGVLVQKGNEINIKSLI